MHISNHRRGAVIAQLGLDDRIARFIDDLKAPGSMARLFEPPWYFYSQGPDDAPEWPGLEERTLLPLWEHQETVYAADLARTPVEYLSFPIESPGDVDVFGDTIHALLLDMIRRHTWEYGGEADEIDEAVSLARELGFPEPERLKRLLEDGAATDADLDRYLALVRHAN